MSVMVCFDGVGIEGGGKCTAFDTVVFVHSFADRERVIKLRVSRSSAVRCYY